MSAKCLPAPARSRIAFCLFAGALAVLIGCGKAQVDFGPIDPTPSVATLAFRAIEGSASVAQSVSVATHNDDALSAYLTNGTSFEVASPAACPQGASPCRISVAFDPKTAGLQADVLNFQDRLTGFTGTISLTGTLYLPPTLSTTSLDFGDQQIGLASTAQALSASGQQQDQLTVSAQPAGVFEVTGGATCTLGVNSCQLAIAFTPASAGPVSGSLTVTDTDSGLTSTVALRGNGVLYPPAMAGLDYYLPFTGNSGDVVMDFSGNGRNGTISGAGTPAIWIGQAGLQPNDQIVTIPSSAGRPVRAVCAYFPAATPAGFSIYDYLFSANIGPVLGQALESSYGQSDQGHGTLADFPAVAITVGTSFTQSVDGYTGIHCIEEIVGTGSGSPDHIVVDGKEVNYLEQSFSSFQLDPLQLTTPMIVQESFADTFPNPPVIYSVWGTATTDTVAEAQMRTSFELSRLLKLGVAVIPPVSTATDSTCSITGTSIDQGFEATQPPSNLLALDYPCTITNFAVSGQAPKDMTGTVQDREQRIVHPRAPKNIAYHGGVTNGVVNYQEKPANALQDVLNWNTKVHALGYKTIVSTMLSRCGNGGYHGMSGDELKQAFNALLLANADAFDWVANLAAAPQIGADNACSNSAYFADAATGLGTHLNDAGQLYYVAAVRAGFEGAYPTASTSILANYTKVPSDTNIIASGNGPYAVTLMDANTANFNSKGILCANNMSKSVLTLAAISGQTVLGSPAVRVAPGSTVCIRANVADTIAAGADWIGAP